MKQTNAIAVAGVAVHESPRCCIARVRNLLDLVRTQHHLQQTKPCVNEEYGSFVEDDLPAPSLHDVHVGELEAFLFVDGRNAPASTETEIRYDDPKELARARWIFALTWLVPLLLVSAILAMLGTTLDRSLQSLLRFSMFALSVPLGGSLFALLLRRFEHRRNRHLGAVPQSTSRPG